MGRPSKRSRAKDLGLLLYRNEGPGRFREMGSAAGLKGSGWAQAACAADIDNDGDIDLAVTYYGSNRLFRNLGGKFEDVTRLRICRSPERDGAPDALGWTTIATASSICSSQTTSISTVRKLQSPARRPTASGKACRSFVGPWAWPRPGTCCIEIAATATFEDVSAKSGILKPGGRLRSWSQLSQTSTTMLGRTSMSRAIKHQASCTRTNATEPSSSAEWKPASHTTSMAALQSGMGVAVADLDGNGFLDIAKTNFSGDLPSLYLNEDGRFYRDTAQEAGLGAHQLLGWGVAFLDVDEDARPDLIMANGHVYPEIDRSKLGERYRQLTLLYRNLGDVKFADITSVAGEPFRAARPARGLAVGDLDGDGRPEIVIVNMNQPPTVLKNKTARGNWIRIQLEGTKSNRSAIGSRVTVEAGGRRQMADVSSGGSYYSQHEFALYFGLGAATKVDAITLRWPNGNSQVFRDVAANRTIAYRE